MGPSPSKSGLTRGVRVLVATALVASAAVFAAPSYGVASTLAAGTVHCNATGAVRFAPKLTTTPRLTKLSVNGVLTCSVGTTNNSAVTVTAGRFKVSSPAATASCTAPPTATGVGNLTWTAVGGKVVPSRATTTSVTYTDGTNVHVDLAGTLGNTTVNRSYAGAEWKLSVSGDTAAGGLCSGAAAAVKFTGTSGASTFDVAPPNPNQLPVQHVVVMMQENRSADHYFARLSATQPAFEAEPTTGNPNPLNPSGPAIVPFHQTSLCETTDLNHSWSGVRAEINGGAMDGFTKANKNSTDPTGARAMGYYDQTDLPFYYGLYDTFATGDRYFSSVPGPTLPNRMFLLAGTSFGHIRNDFSLFNQNVPSVFPLLDQHGVSWKIYASQYPLSFAGMFFTYVSSRASQHVFPMSQYYADLANGQLPAVSFIDPDFNQSGPTATDEHPPSDVQVGQKFVADAINGLMQSSAWSSSAVFLTYDEHGGYYDHVVPPAATVPDANAPMLLPGDTAGTFDIYGIRVPAVVVSPFAKAHYVSHVVNDHTSILKFIEHRFGLPSLTNRDAAANPMLEMFDFQNPAFTTPPTLPSATIDPVRLAACS